jgi:predicted nucleotidyltransferase
VIIHDLKKRGVITPPEWLPDNTEYLVTTGSVAYGASEDTSDQDIQGFCIPMRDNVFPHLTGEIVGFGKQTEPFGVWQQHHAIDNGKEYDFAVYSIVRFFQLAMDNNPNMVDLLFVPQDCVRHMTDTGFRVKAHRHLFLHKGIYFKMRGYALSQLYKMGSKTPQEGGKREASVKEFGYDVKFAYHIVRLMLECEQALELYDIDLRRDREMYKSIRRGEWTQEEIRDWFADKERHLEALYQKTQLPDVPNEKRLKELLLSCLEQHYGSLAGAERFGEPRAELAIADVIAALKKSGYL